MITTTRLFSTRILLLLLLAWPLYSMAGVDGQYAGEYSGKKVTMVLETATTTMTGVLGIGGENYILRAESSNGSISGQLTAMTSGKVMALNIKTKGNAIDVEVTPKGGDVMHFTLKRVE